VAPAREEGGDILGRDSSSACHRPVKASRVGAKRSTPKSWSTSFCTGRLIPDTARSKPSDRLADRARARLRLFRQRAFQDDRHQRGDGHHGGGIEDAKVGGGRGLDVSR
jgi:hypothetical protein